MTNSCNGNSTGKNCVSNYFYDLCIIDLYEIQKCTCRIDNNFNCVSKQWQKMNDIYYSMSYLQFFLV
jgi:hypothetical protein